MDIRIVFTNLFQDMTKLEMSNINVLSFVIKNIIHISLIGCIRIYISNNMVKAINEVSMSNHP